ncbi:hypothetical protein POM88_045055 [Heracleum sosnowskyi]|uniref:Uncharacterized protein n=1 Tax=Heracleum sosnowskyi TaxID=360622 RepID=A0AAD8H6C0_9APIA|nr:hypothetical protein POM88_045055 [Heracleum sosnowskyi]
MLLFRVIDGSAFFALQTVHTDPDKILPLVGYFPTSFDPFKDSGDSSEVNVYQNVKRGEVAAPQLCTFALGVLDKDTRTLKIVPITSNKHFYRCWLREGSLRVHMELKSVVGILTKMTTSWKHINYQIKDGAGKEVHVLVEKNTADYVIEILRLSEVLGGQEVPCKLFHQRRSAV